MIARSAVATLQGAPQLKRRLRAIRAFFKPAGLAWADETVKVMRSSIPARTGATRRSVRRRNATEKKATVVSSHVAYFIDAGSKAHVIKPRKAARLVFEVGGRTIFARKVNHPRIGARPFRKKAALEGLRRKPLVAALIKEWNAAGGTAVARVGE